ncbi:hypothetical protein, partial [Halorubrum sp. Ea8]|uniref:hypothetical protein n=1 Tax=Halorubrum sp. Ea8 TaxID=1383841 RepID=UPI001C3E44DC
MFQLADGCLYPPPVAVLIAESLQSRLDRHGKMPPVAETPDAGSGESDTHTIWITDMDVGERDLEGLG